jgi:copper chaperone CopZ
MTHTFEVKGMTCNSCRAKVAKAIERIEGIQSVSITLEPPEAVIAMSKHVPVALLNKALAAEGNYSLSEIEGSRTGMSIAANPLPTPEEKKPFLTAYKPILLVFAFLLGTTVLSEIHKGGFNPERAMSFFMGSFFLVFSFFKLLDLKGFAYSYMSYDIVAARWLAYGFIYPFIELSLGVAYMMHFYPALTNAVTGIVMGISSIGVAKTLLDRKPFKCACLGTVFNLPMSNITLIEDALMAAMAVFMLIG